jgi:hypothetical protein
MPTPGLSLVGFLDEQSAIRHLTEACVPASLDPVLLRAEWQTAKATLGAPIPNFGNPGILPIPPGEGPYMQALCAQQWVAEYLANAPGATFSMVEIDPLLAFQFSVDGARSDQHCAHLQQPPTVHELMNCCLPMATPPEEIRIVHLPSSILLKSRGLNIRLMAHGFFNAPGVPNTLGMQFGSALPLVHVARFNGRCYLQNGFHRAVGIRKAGATHIPAVVRDVATPEEVGINPGTFPLTLLESADPPTLGHFTQGRALAVQVRAMSRVFNVSWAEYAVPDE